MTQEHSRVFFQAFKATIPVLTGYIFLGIGYGIVLRTAGFGVGWAFAFSFFVYSGAVQFLAIELITGGASLLTIAFTTLLVSARHLFYGISLIDKYKNAGWRKPYMIFSLTDETYSLAIQDPPNLASSEHCQKHQIRYYFLISMLNQIYWLAGSVIGNLLGGKLPFNSEGIDFALTALFITIVTDQWLKAGGIRQRIPALIGAVSAIICLGIFGSNNFLLPTMLMILILLLAGKKSLSPNNHFSCPVSSDSLESSRNSAEPSERGNAS